MTKRRLGALERLYPMPCVLLASGSLDNPGLLTAAWINVVSSTPPTLVVGLRESRKTLADIERSNCFSVNIPTAEMAPVVDFIGSTSANNGANKLATTDLTISAGRNYDIPLIDQCPYNLECVVSDISYVGSYHIVTAEIVESYAEENVLEDAEGNVVSMDALDPLIYIAGSREYRRLGEKVADAYQIGKTYTSSPRQR